MAAWSMRGDLSELGKLEQHLRRLAEVPSRAAAGAAAGIAAAIEREFDAGVDPYGEAWAPLAPSTLARGRSHPPLTDTGAMRQSITVEPMAGAGVQITIGVDYAVFHQTGTARMPARKILPEGGVMPPEWERAIEDAVHEAFDRAATEE